MGHKIKILVSITIAIFILVASGASAQVGIGTTNPDTTAGLDVNFTNKGFLPPRMTTAQRNAIINPADGLMIFNITTGCHNYFYINSWYELCGVLTPSGTIGSLNCISASMSGALAEGAPADGVSASVPYTGGNGQYHPGQIVGSTGIAGLTASLSPGVFNIGSGYLTYNITGTPVISGTAIFALNIGGQTCNLEVTVSFICGISPVTFTYNGSQVNYGTVSSANNRCWLDRNLGASQVATGSMNTPAYGHFFQWGRLDDGHQVRTSPTTTSLSNSDVPGHGNFILAPNNPHDWRSPQNNNLWQGSNGTNNPCPAGFRVPTQSEWETERASWSSYNSAGAFSSPLKLPAPGYRSYLDGSLNFEDFFGLYWSSTISNIWAWYLRFNIGEAYMSANYRAYGMSVRCIKD